MKNLLRLFALGLVLVSGTVLGQTSNLTHRYNFNSSASDLIGSADGTLQGAAILTNGALVLDGTNSYLALPAGLVTGYTAITLEAWVTDFGSGAWARIFDFGNNTTDYMFLSLPAGGGNLRGAYTTNGNTAEQLLQWSGGRPPVGQESHIVWATDAATHIGRLYVNGVQVGVNSNMTYSPAILGPTVNNWLGRSQFSADHYFYGAFDEFRIYNYALSSNAIVADYQAGPNALDTGPVYFYQQPQNQSVTEWRPVTFTAGVGGTPPYWLQWFRNNSPVNGATNSSLTFTATIADDSAVFQLWATNVVSNTVYVAASSNAVLTVAADTNPPVLLGALVTSVYSLQLQFSEALQAATASDLSDYSITGPSGPVAITGAALDATGSNVTLGIPPLQIGSNYIVTVTYIRDLAGNLIAPNSQATFTYQPNQIVIQADQPGIQISSNLFGIFFEELSSAGDGGLYAELIRNRSFEDNPTNAVNWSFVTSGTATGQWSLDTSLPLSATNTNALSLTFQSGVGTVGAANSGYWGIPVSAGAAYNLNLYARGVAGFTGPVTVSLENSSGSSVYAQTTIGGLTVGWQHFTRALFPSASDPAARLVLRISSAGTVVVDFVSLFPAQTFNNRTNGLRPDLANMLVNLRPAFMRFPGGAWVDGSGVPNFYNWETTVGDPANRVPRWDLWGYMVDNGLGYHEYLQFCEDLGAAPLFVVNCGMDYSTAVPTNQLAPYVQIALDAIQYANGDTNTPWGAQRAANGHPAPFNLRYLEIGNENGGSAYNDHYAFFYDAIKAQYPYIQLIANTPVSSRPMDIVDEHFYSSPSFFIQQSTRYDSYSRSGPKVFVGEYAVKYAGDRPNLTGALGEAAFMTGMERNSDVVLMASYAPLFANLNNQDWNPNLIYFNGTQVYGTPSYYCQQMFSLNRGDYVLPTAVTTAFMTPTNHGAIGVGTWNTQSAYSNLTVMAGSNVLYQSDFTTTAGTNGYQFLGTNWILTNGLLEQTGPGTDLRATTGSTTWSNYTYTARAMKLSGSEGFLIMFNVLDTNNFMWWNIGGWNNTQTGIEWAQNGAKTLLASVPMAINTGQWYDIRIVLGNRIQCYLNGTLVHDIPSPSSGIPLYASGSLVPSRGQVVLKAVNETGSPLITQVGLPAARGLDPTATATVLTSANPLSENSLAQPTNVYPVTTTVTGVTTNFQYTLAPYSLTVLRFQELPDSPVGISLGAPTNQLSLSALSNGIPIQLSSFITNNVSVDYTVDTPGGLLASGTAQFVPGDLAKLIALSIPNLQSYSLVRVTLANPVGGQLTGLTQTYYVNLPDVAGQPVLGLAQFGDQTLLYWSNPGDTLYQADTVLGPWNALPGLPSPVSLTLTNPQAFYLLKR